MSEPTKVRVTSENDNLLKLSFYDKDGNLLFIQTVKDLPRFSDLRKIYPKLQHMEIR